MFKNLDTPVTYDTLKNISYFDLNAPYFELWFWIFLTTTFFTLAALLAILILYDISILERIIYTFIVFISVISIYIVLDKTYKHFTIKYYLDQNPYYRNVNITGTINDISNGSDSNTQELRFSHNNENYYIIVPSKVVTQTNDKITVKIKKQLVIDELNLNNLNDDLKHQKSNIIIKHHNKTYHTTMTDKGDIDIND